MKRFLVFGAVVSIVVASVTQADAQSVRRVTDAPYFATCQGSDETAKFQWAFNDAQPGDTIEFPGVINGQPARCAYSTGLTLQDKANITIRGAGMDNTVLLALNPAGSVILVEGGHDIEIDDLELNSPYTVYNATPSNGFWAKRTVSIHFNRIRVRGTANAFQLGGVRDSGVHYCQMIGTDGAGVQIDGAWDVGSSYNVNVDHNVAWATGDDGYATVSYGGTLNEYIGFFDNESWYAGSNPSRGGTGVRVEGSHCVQIYRNHIEGTYGSAIVVSRQTEWGYGLTDEVDVRWNTLTDTRNYLDGRPTAVFGMTTNAAPVMNIHIRDNVIWNPQCPFLFWIQADSPSTPYGPFQITGNAAYDYDQPIFQDFVILGCPNWSGSWISDNTLDNVPLPVIRFPW